MSRAFMKETDAPEPRCDCGGAGISVSRATLDAILGAETAAAFHGDAFYCDDPACAIAYFDAFGTRSPRERMARSSYPKDPSAPVCSCFGTAAETIEDWARRGDKASMRELLLRIEGPEARCAQKAPDGRSCATEVRKLFMRAMQ